jgi:hypothetical protein
MLNVQGEDKAGINFNFIVKSSGELSLFANLFGEMGLHLAGIDKVVVIFWVA